MPEKMSMKMHIRQILKEMSDLTVSPRGRWASKPKQMFKDPESGICLSNLRMSKKVITTEEDWAKKGVAVVETEEAAKFQIFWCPMRLA